MTPARRAAASDGPILLELVTYRMGAHTNSDDPTRYVPDDELADWRGAIRSSRSAPSCIAAGLWDDDVTPRAVDEVKARVERIIDSRAARDRRPATACSTTSPPPATRAQPRSAPRSSLGACPATCPTTRPVPTTRPTATPGVSWRP